MKIINPSVKLEDEINNKVVLKKLEIIEKVYAIANNAIYFNDRSDYLKALYEICTILKPLGERAEIGKRYIKEGEE